MGGPAEVFFFFFIFLGSMSKFDLQFNNVSNTKFSSFKLLGFPIGSNYLFLFACKKDSFSRVFEFGTNP